VWPARTPRLSVFSGSAKENESSYELWRYELRCLQTESSYDEHTILEAARRSLKGEAAKAVMRLGVKCDVKALLAKLDSLYGTVGDGCSLVADFYACKQGGTELVSVYSARLEDLWSRAMEAGQLRKEDAQEVLRSKFWNGLTQEMRDRSGHKFDTVKDFDELRRAIRALETTAEMKTVKSSAKAAQPQDVTALQVQVQQLQGQLAAMKKQYSSEQKQRQHKQDPQHQTYTPRADMECWRCGEKGHIKLGCRNPPKPRTDGATAMLNDNRLAAAGRR